MVSDSAGVVLSRQRSQKVWRQGSTLGFSNCWEQMVQWSSSLSAADLRVEGAVDVGDLATCGLPMLADRTGEERTGELCPSMLLRAASGQVYGLRTGELCPSILVRDPSIRTGDMLPSILFRELSTRKGELRGCGEDGDIRGDATRLEDVLEDDRRGDVLGGVIRVGEFLLKERGLVGDSRVGVVGDVRTGEDRKDPPVLGE